MTPQDDSRRARSPRRLRLQFGLRWLMVVVLVICLALGRHVERVRRQREAVAALEQAGAEVAYRQSEEMEAAYSMAGASPQDFLEGIDDPRNVREWIESSTPGWLRTKLGIDFFRRVGAVSSGNQAGFPFTLDHLPNLPGLQRLDLFFALDEDLELVGTLGDLTELQFWNSVISDAGLARLGRLQKLESLDLKFGEDRLNSQWRQPITDAGLAHLATLRRLKRLNLSGSAIRGAGLRHLAQMSDLDSLDLTRTPVTDDGLASLRSLTNLRDLDLSRTTITDRGLRVLGDLASLERIDIDGTLATSDGAALLKRRLPNASVHYSQEQTDFALYRARVLMRGGRWRQAIEELEAPEASYLSSSSVAYMCYLGECHAELAQWDQAQQEFCKALEQLFQERRPVYALAGWYSQSTVRAEIYLWPQVFERVARARPNDVWRWVTSAQRAVLDGRWSSAAADYARAMECLQGGDWDWESAEIVFEYGVSQLLAGDPAAHRRVCDHFLERERRITEAPPKDGPEYQDYLSAGQLGSFATRISCIAPRDSLEALRIANSRWEELLPLAYYRAGEFENVLRQKKPKHEGVGVYWFSRAMAYHRLKRFALARECFARGAHWLERRMKDDCIRGDQRDAGDFLQTEALRREAERLIFKPGADK